MTRAKQELFIAMLQAVANRLRDRPDEIDREHDTQNVPPLARIPGKCGRLEVLCENSAIEINALIETFLRPRGRKRTSP